MKFVPSLIALTGAATLASGSVVPFTESFDTDTSNWLSGSFSPTTWVSNGALDGSSYITTNVDLNTAGPFGLTLLRGHDDFDASGDAFVGNYLTSGITTVEFDFRHNAGVDLDIALRLASSANTPGLAVQTGGLVASGEWVHLSFSLFFGNPLMTLEGPPTPELFNAVMTQIGNVQVSSFRPDGLSTPLLVDFDLDNVTITPTPSSAALLGFGGLIATRRRR